MIKEELHRELDNIKPSDELTEKIRLMMNEEAAKNRRNRMRITPAKIGLIAAACAVVAGSAVALNAMKSAPAVNSALTAESPMYAVDGGAPQAAEKNAGAPAAFAAASPETKAVTAAETAAANEAEIAEAEEAACEEYFEAADEAPVPSAEECAENIIECEPSAAPSECADASVCCDSEESIISSSSVCMTVIEINETDVILCPLDGSPELASSDRFSVPSEAFSECGEITVGNIVEIFYNGGILETYPAAFEEIYTVIKL